MKLLYKGTPVTMQWSRYGAGGRLCLTLIGDTPEREPEARVTINLPDEPLKDDHAFVQDWSEGEGMLEWLRTYHIAEFTGRRVRSGHVLVPEVRWLPGSHWSAKP